MLKIAVLGLQAAQSATASMARFHGVKTGLAAAATHLRGKFAKYPAKKKLKRADVYGSAFKTVKQRRWFWASLKKGTLKLPYVRGVSGGSESLAKRWTNQSENSGLRQVIGNNASYVEHVQGEKQSLYMARMGWQRVDKIAERERAAVNRIVYSYVERDFK